MSETIKKLQFTCPNFNECGSHQLREVVEVWDTYEVNLNSSGGIDHGEKIDQYDEPAEHVRFECGCCRKEIARSDIPKYFAPFPKGEEPTAYGDASCPCSLGNNCEVTYATMDTATIGIQRDDGDLHVLATFNNNDRMMCCPKFHDLVEKTKQAIHGILADPIYTDNLILLERQDAPDYVTLEGE